MPSGHSATTGEFRVGDRVCFAYAHRYRALDVKRIWHSREGYELITGIDPDIDEYRTFRRDRIMRGKVRVVHRAEHGGGARGEAPAAQDAHHGGSVPAPRR